MAVLQRTDDPKDLGLDGRRLELADRLLAEWTERGDPPMPAAALLVGRKDLCLSGRFFGKQGPRPDDPPIRRDGLFLLASITKPVVYLAALQLVEQGKLGLSDPVIRYIPEFAANHKNETLVLHLLTHTSGLPDMLPDNVELRRAQAPLERFIQGAIEVAPHFPPGTDYRYQSMGTLITAEIVQRISGMKIRDYLRKHIFDPLGMADSALGSDGLDLDRLVRVEADDNSEAAWNWNSPYWRRFGAPWGGMFSSPDDFAKLCHAVLPGNNPPVRVMSPAMIQAMTINQLERIPTLPGDVIRRHGWGLGWKLNFGPATDDPFCELLGPQVFGHLGATGTTAWLDPATGLFFILFTTGVRARASWRHTRIANIVASSLQS